MTVNHTDQGPQHPSNQSANPASGPNKAISPDDAEFYQDDEDRKNVEGNNKTRNKTTRKNR